MKELLLSVLFSFFCFDVFSAEKTSTNSKNDDFFIWAEYSYPAVFSPAETQTRLISGYNVRYYADTNSFLGVKEGVVYTYGPAFGEFENIGGGIRIIGALNNFTELFNAGGFIIEREANLIVNEAVAKAPDGGPDWFELYAAGTQAVSLREYQVKDGKDERALSSLPDIILSPGEYRVITATDESADDEFSVPFKLGSNDRVQLFHHEVLVDELNWNAGEAPEGYSFGRNPEDLSQILTLLPTLAEQNQLAPPNTLPGYPMGAVGSMLSSNVHEISFTVDLTEYEIMINHYASSGEKIWLDVLMMIDGEQYEQVGIRLKGNSSLRKISASDDPATLPWLVKMDKFINGQDHDGLEEFAIRSSKTKTAMNEAVALELLEQAGLASQDAIAVALQANDGDTVLRLAIEHPDDEWMKEEFDRSGALYKAESTGDYRYRGDNPDDYDDVFDQEAGKKNADLAPLINFLKFINEADTATFNAELNDYLDITAFAVYLAMQDLLNNFDDIDGPGNNSYLYFDTRNDQFTIVPWDYNLAFGTLIKRGEFVGIVIPGSDEIFSVGDNDDESSSADDEIETSSNILVHRFLANETWNTLYVQQQEVLRSTLYDSGIATDILEFWRTIISGTGLVNEADITADAEKIRQHFE